MQVSEIMTANPVVLGPDTSLREAAQKMRDLDSGVMPVGENDRVIGMLTDRDITVRATADGKDPNTTLVRDVISADVLFCFADDEIEVAARKMEEHQVRRLVVLNHDNQLVGLVSLGDLAVHAPSDRLPGEVTEAVSEPS